MHAPMVPTLLSDPQFAVPSLVRIPEPDVVHGFTWFFLRLSFLLKSSACHTD